MPHTHTCMEATAAHRPRNLGQYCIPKVPWHTPPITHKVPKAHFFRTEGSFLWKPVLRQHRARASCGGHVLVKVKLVLKDNAKWAYTRSGHTRNILVARICYLRDIDPFCPEPLRLDLIDPNATNYTTCCGLQHPPMM